MRSEKLMRAGLFCGLIVAVTTVPVITQAATYDCTMTSKSGRGGVPDRVTVRIDPDRGLAAVRDSMTAQIDIGFYPVALKAVPPDRYQLN